MKVRQLLSVIVFCAFATHIFAQTMVLSISNISDDKGQLCIAVFSSEDDFKAEKPCYEKQIDKQKVIHHQLIVEIPFHSGHYGVSVLDDSNYDGKMQYNLICIPREGFGFSNYFHRGLSKPVFSDFAFYLEKNETKTLNIRMRYY